MSFFVASRCEEILYILILTVYVKQLVGTALIIIVKATLLGAIRNVEATTKKVLFFFVSWGLELTLVNLDRSPWHVRKQGRCRNSP